MKLTKIKHPDADIYADVVPSAVASWQLSGWTVVDDESDVAESVHAEEVVPESGPADPDDLDEEL